MKKILGNSYIAHGLGLTIAISYMLLTSSFDWGAYPSTVENSLVICLVTYLVTANILPRISKYLLVERKYYILPVMATIYAITLTFILLTRIDYSRPVIIHGFFISFLIFYALGVLLKDHRKLKLAAIKNFDFEDLNDNKNIQLSELSNFEVIPTEHDGLVLDLHKELTTKQSKFVADCSINNIPVFHSESIREMVAGKVQTSHLSENSIGTLQPNPIYRGLKRVWESILIIVSFPITLPIMALTSVLIKLENPGPAMFIQERIGQGGKPFRIYKFRSMTVRPKDAVSKFATEEQARVTRVGKVIRKVRIDELPQFFNVLKGEMSLIGPRPEQESFVKQFEEEIPFYGYRHMVKPGITGWAQTVQGYTDDTESTTEKLAHDLYYIKHLSFWLDMNIVIKTIRTMLTGFGAK
ncbi:exopolysaccharide biosynthesis polyprenyl glycosylphosphotransferase [Vibrio breoganii]|uniref:exopolysaccharide biosynthesis polyprenyl glycosylphosphotransferase n=1 Tax=Vibrio breoganii TaxID=553239 RepID=UPI000C826FAA|nr:exopolysaccharide biosynthesis polyprenyl glycosylphosphotransferase [Vibrio breoganii]PML92304.1 UDP-glucose lipid carrier transferase [Vibrio breoganii]PMN65019.1 UDP-glucose lipid carrier transferase [Vibrio breoganii]